ncbi:P27 family phage terminase small subunit [Bacillus sp. V2I10]|uniref:P27 family phage terminase small subunit n=1 Tax=Bacillus sp. V2I10 TaxID=3042276 RepID=UPI0027833B34|nr:P27 family phage terminase small subunit [Bacillus sp. V2I10]MDQ0861604.1 phage terminase small subunit [Bacillus sp. V2I10]
MKQQFSSSNLSNLPDHIFLRNEKVYAALVSNLKDLGLGFHLKDIDIFSLAAAANTIDLLNEIEIGLVKHGAVQTIMTREGFEKVVASPYVQMRSTQLNLLQSQLKSLQLDPASRQLLTQSVLNDVNMIDDEIDEGDELLNSIMKRLD